MHAVVGEGLPLNEALIGVGAGEALDRAFLFIVLAKAALIRRTLGKVAIR